MTSLFGFPPYNDVLGKWSSSSGSKRLRAKRRLPNWWRPTRIAASALMTTLNPTPHARATEFRQRSKKPFCYPPGIAEGLLYYSQTTFVLPAQDETRAYKSSPLRRWVFSSSRLKATLSSLGPFARCLLSFCRCVCQTEAL